LNINSEVTTYKKQIKFQIVNKKWKKWLS
jgi:hypothetical protein